MLDVVRHAAHTTVGGLLRQQATIRPRTVAIEDGVRRFTYRQFNERVNRLSNLFEKYGVQRGDRVAVLAENRIEYVEAAFAAAKSGAMLAALNWRLSADELDYCIDLAAPRFALVSPRHAERLTPDHTERVLVFGDAYERALSEAGGDEPPDVALPEDGLVILYTSGTTGRPKGAVISHRAFLYRVLVFCVDYGLSRRETFPAWPPMFHMASMDLAIGSLLVGGRVFVVDGFDLDALVRVAADQPISWFCLMPGVIDQTIARLQAEDARPRAIRVAGAMADLVPRHQISDVSRLLNAPYLNSFGSTETGIPPTSAGQIPPGVVPSSLAKTQSSYCEVRLVDENDRDVPLGTPGELAMRGPTLFSGYWQNDDANTEDFRGGWFHMGDMFRRHDDGTFDFVDRAKYLIKSGGENIYPAEIERVLLEDERVADAVVVRASDPKWGEVPVAVVARGDRSLTSDDLVARCRDKLAGYKRPKQIHFVALDELPRSTTGKIQRHEVEARLRRDQ